MGLTRCAGSRRAGWGAFSLELAPGPLAVWAEGRTLEAEIIRMVMLELAAFCVGTLVNRREPASFEPDGCLRIHPSDRPTFVGEVDWFVYRLCMRHH
jgi:hypothetical protein